MWWSSGARDWRREIRWQENNAPTDNWHDSVYTRVQMVSLKSLIPELSDQVRFLFLGNHFNYTSRWLSVFVKVCVQQAVFTPVFNTYFFGMQAILTGESPFGVIERIKNTVPTSMYNSLKLWPAVTAFSFAFIMPQYRFMFSGIFAVCWQTYLSFLNRKAEKLRQETLPWGVQNSRIEDCLLRLHIEPQT